MAVHRRIFGYDPNAPERSAELFAKNGFSAVVGGKNDGAAEIFRAAGLDYYVACGCFSLPEDPDPSLLCTDCTGRATAWFGSGCPNEPQLRQNSLQLAAELAASKNICGVILDAARFASPGGEGGRDPFFTCFCPRCMEKMERLGFDARKIRSAVRALRTHLRTGAGYRETEHRPALEDWLRFRRVCVTGHLADFTAVLREKAPALRLGIYCFSPSLAPLVGQSYPDIARYFDFASPMLYRYYAPEIGVACPDHEWAAILSWLEQLPEQSAAPVRELLTELTGQQPGELGTARELWENGCPVQWIAKEACRARAELGSCALEPILALGDPCFLDCARAVEPFAQTIDCFAYDAENFSRCFCREKADVYRNDGETQGKFEKGRISSERF